MEPMATEFTTGLEKFLPNRPLMAAPSERQRDDDPEMVEYEH